MAGYIITKIISEFNIYISRHYFDFAIRYLIYTLINLFFNLKKVIITHEFIMKRLLQM